MRNNISRSNSDRVPFAFGNYKIQNWSNISHFFSLLLQTPPLLDPKGFLTAASKMREQNTIKNLAFRYI